MCNIYQNVPVVGKIYHWKQSTALETTHIWITIPSLSDYVALDRLLTSLCLSFLSSKMKTITEPIWVIAVKIKIDNLYKAFRILATIFHWLPFLVLLVLLPLLIITVVIFQVGKQALTGSQSFHPALHQLVSLSPNLPVIHTWNITSTKMPSQVAPRPYSVSLSCFAFFIVGITSWNYLINFNIQLLTFLLCFFSLHCKLHVEEILSLLFTTIPLAQYSA